MASSSNAKAMTSALPGGRDRPWLMRTYSGHSSAAASNALYRQNLARGQTGLSVAFDLPTQTGYDPDHPLARGEVGKVGVPIAHIGDMQALLRDIPLDRMNTSLTINATAPWLLALYVAVAERQGIDRAALRGTTQNDIIKEYLARGTYIFPPEASLALTRDVIEFSVTDVPNWNPVNICSYHLQEAGATPVQELAYALASAFAVLDAARDAPRLVAAAFDQAVGRMSFFVNAGLRFVEEMCKMRAFVTLWDELTAERYGIADPKLRRFRYGVQVNSLGLTASQPENNVARIILEMLAVTLSRDARARAIQLPAWNEALGLPRPWDQQWALRMQQILALETDLLEYPDLFEGSAVVERKTAELVAATRAELASIEAAGGMVEAVRSGAVKRALVASLGARMQSIESGDAALVGVNCFTDTAQSALVTGAGSDVLELNPATEREQIEAVRAFRAERDAGAAGAALDALKQAAAVGANIMEPSIQCAHAGVTTGEWASALRACFGEYRAPTGIDTSAPPAGNSQALQSLRERARELAGQLDGPPRVLIAKPGLDGHSNGAEQVALRCRDAALKVRYDGIRMTPEDIARTAVADDVHLLGLSVLSGTHIELVAEVRRALIRHGRGDIPVVVGGIVPDDDAARLRRDGVAAVYTPKDPDLNDMVAAMLDSIAAHASTASGSPQPT